MYLVLRVTLEGDLNPRSSYVENIKVIDEAARGVALPALSSLLTSGDWSLSSAAMAAGTSLRRHFGSQLREVRLFTNPCLSASVIFMEEIIMTTLTQRFEFSAAHRLHNDSLDAQTNRDVFGKCNNPAGHGHNYELEVTLAADSAAGLTPIDRFAHIVNEIIIDRFDHKHLNIQTAEFAQIVPSVENIAKVIYGLLKPAFAAPTTLRSVRVWETPKTSAEYSE